MPDADNDGRLFIITGTSGTGIEESLSRWCTNRPRSTAFIRLEHHLLMVAKETFGLELTMNQLFERPESVLRDLWVDAGSRAIADVAQALKEGDVFFRLNACWYHGASGGFIFGVHIPTLIRLPTPKLVITLIDDVYDTLIRLQRSHKIFESSGPSDTISTTLLKLLAWREFEVRGAQHIALSFDGVRYVLFSVKHPVATFERLLDSLADDCIYLSHPISVLRREELSLTDLNQGPLLDLIQQTATHLRQAESVVLFEPTSIDEWRMIRDLDSGEIQSLDLLRRWPTAVTATGEPAELLAEPLGKDELVRSEQPFSGSGESLEGLRVLSNEIRNQIGWRDRLMLEQSSQLLVIEPFASSQGTMSGGVQMEIDYHADLKLYFDASGLLAFDGNRPRIAIASRHVPVVYHPEHDEKKRQIGAIIATLEALVAQGKLEHWPPPNVSNFLVKLRHELQLLNLNSWLEKDDLDVTVELESCFPPSGRGHAVRIVGQSSGGPLGGGFAAARDRACQEFGRRVKTAIAGTAEPDSDYSTVQLENCIILSSHFESGEELADAMLDLVSEGSQEKRLSNN
jgi:hypothetical protein